MIIVSEYLKKSFTSKTLSVAQKNLYIAKQIIEQIESFQKNVDEIEKKVRYILDVDDHKNYKIIQEEMHDLDGENDMGIVLIITFEKEFDENYAPMFDRQVKALRGHFVHYRISTWENENMNELEVMIQIEFENFLQLPYTNKDH